MWVTKGVDVVQAEKMWKALVTTLVAFGKVEAEAVTMVTREVFARALLMIAPTVALASQLPAKKCMD